MSALRAVSCRERVLRRAVSVRIRVAAECPVKGRLIRLLGVDDLPEDRHLADLYALVGEGDTGSLLDPSDDALADVGAGEEILLDRVGRDRDAQADARVVDRFRENRGDLLRSLIRIFVVEQGVSETSSAMIS